MQGWFVSYLRVSTDRQGKSGLGLEAQRAAVATYLNGSVWTLLAEMIEVESGKATADRPQLARAMALCRLTGAILCVAKLDRLSRDAPFLIGLDKADVDFVAVDMPNANKLTVGIMGKHPASTAGDQAAAAVMSVLRQFQGSSSSSCEAGWSAMVRSTWASQARGSTSFSLAVTIRL